MGKTFLVLSDKLEEQFRRKAFEKYGGKKGHLSKALEDAIQKWIDNKEK